MKPIKFLSKKKNSKFNFPLLAMCRNEIYFLPYFFDHYRKLGVDYFLIYDDHSSDGSLEFLLSQQDCDVITSDNKYSDTFGTNPHGNPVMFSSVLKNQIPDKYFAAKWNIVVDIDEFLILPQNYPTLEIFTNKLDAVNKHYITSPMVDFYPAEMRLTKMDKDLSPFKNNPYFDLGPYYNFTNTYKVQSLPAGLRFRLWDLLRKNNFILYEKLQPNNRLILPTAIKYPLIKSGMGVYRVGEHYINATPYGQDHACLAHFKLYPGINDKVQNALDEKQHFNQSIEYVLLDYLIKNLEGQSLISKASVIYENSDSFTQANLLASI
jgi:hypothetical protein